MPCVIRTAADPEFLERRPRWAPQLSYSTDEDSDCGLIRALGSERRWGSRAEAAEAGTSCNTWSACGPVHGTPQKMLCTTCFTLLMYMHGSVTRPRWSALQCRPYDGDWRSRRQLCRMWTDGVTDGSDRHFPVVPYAKKQSICETRHVRAWATRNASRTWHCPGVVPAVGALPWQWLCPGPMVPAC